MNQLELIQSKIYEIRGQRVMLDFDLAELYQVETRVLNQAVKRNIDRFPEDFMFQVTAEEWVVISSQFVMTSRNKRPKSALPLAFTEHGVVMLSSVLRSDIAVQTSVLITRAFVAMRQMIANSPVIMSAQHQKEMKELKEYIEDVFADQNDINEDTRMQIELINQVLAELQVHKKLSEKTRRPIGFILPKED
nr:ORF6N domain-containing protein [Odoribacter splanchnicus]